MARGEKVRWTVHLTLAEGRRSGGFELPSLRCSGTFTVVGDASLGLRLSTSLTRDEGSRCAALRNDPLTLTATAPGRLELTWPKARGVKPVVLGLDGPEGAPRMAPRLIGTWSGRLGAAQRQVEATFSPDRTDLVGTIEFPRQGCTGDVAITSGNGTDGIEAIADFGAAPQRCHAMTGDLNVSVLDDGATATITYNDQNGTLRRER